MVNEVFYPMNKPQAKKLRKFKKYKGHEINYKVESCRKEKNKKRDFKNKAF